MIVNCDEMRRTLEYQYDGDGDEATEEDDEDHLPGHRQETQSGQCVSAGRYRHGSSIYSSCKLIFPQDWGRPPKCKINKLL